MAMTGVIDRAALPAALDRVAELPGDRVQLAPLLAAAYRLFDRVGAHDAFYVVLAQLQGAPLLTADGRLARAAEALGVTVLLRQSR
jgi:predicted nucleic acid-binding protein